MTVFLGDRGRVLIERKKSDEALLTVVNDSDVRSTVNRFSIDFAHEQVITGDRLEVRTTGANAGEDINWIDHPSVDDSFTRYAHVDAAGGIRLYDTFPESLEGKTAGAIQLKTPAVAQETQVRIMEDTEANCLADVTSYEITTSRETIDTTHLGAHYMKQYEAGLIQGQGTIDCFWTLPGSDCGEDYTQAEVKEFSSYLARLCIRLVHGAAFHGYFYIYADDSNVTRSVWYEGESCIVTNVAVSVEPTQLVRATINFVTNGPIVLREGYLPSFLEVEQSIDLIGLEQGGQIELDNPDE